MDFKSFQSFSNIKAEPTFSLEEIPQPFSIDSSHNFRIKMKKMDIFCASQASTAICLSMDQAASSSSTAQFGGKAIDRHNPIIRDSKRFTRTAHPINPCVPQPPPIEPKPCQVQFHQVPKPKKSKQTDKKAKKKSSFKENDAAMSRDNASDQLEPPQLENELPVKSLSVARDTNNVISREDKVVSSRKNWAQVADLITPPGSSRYLLSESTFSNGITDYEPVESKKSSVPAVKQNASTAQQLEKPSMDQVVVLRVSLHCKGCEGKLRKHLSKMEGVTSFNIDFKAKKVTIVGNVTPLGALASVSKVKNAQFWTVPTWSPTATPCNNIRLSNLEAMK